MVTAADTAAEALEQGGLSGWNLRKVPTFAPDGQGGQVPIDGQYAVLRDNPDAPGTADALGVVGGKYHVIQNEELEGLLDALVEQSGATFDTAGAIDGGRRVFITLKLPGHITVNKVDVVETYLSVVTSHDGSSSTSIMVAPVRVGSGTVLNLALPEASNAYRVRHTTGAPAVLKEQARDALDFAFDYLDAFTQEATRLIKAPMTQTAFEKALTKGMGAGPTASLATQTRAQSKVEQISRLAITAYSGKGIKGTAWAALNTLAEWYDHHSPVRPDGGSETHARSRNAILRPEPKNSALAMIQAAL